MRKILLRCGLVMALLCLGALPVFVGCGTEDTGLGPDPDGPGSPVDYFVPAVGFADRFTVLASSGESLGVASLRIVDTFSAEDFSGFVAIDSFFTIVDTFWLVTAGDTVFQLEEHASYAQRQPVVRNRTESELTWSLYSVGDFGSAERYTVILIQQPKAEMVVNRFHVYTACGRTDLVAVYDQSGDTVLLGSEYFSPTITHGRVLSYTKPFVESERFYRELID